MARRSVKQSENKPIAASLEHVSVAIATLVPHPRNPKRHPPEQLQRLAASIRRFGQPRDVLVRKANSMIIAGHGVTEACALAGHDPISIVLWDVDQPTADAFMLGDNRLGGLGSDDKERTRELLRELGFIDPESIGFDAVEVKALLDGAVDDIDVVEVPTGSVEDRFWISVRGPLRDQAVVLKRLMAAMEDLGEVEVDLGTMADG